MKMMKKFMVVMENKRRNMGKAEQLIVKKNRRFTAKCFQRILKLNEFERNWLFDVRYELHFKEMVQAQFDAMKLNVKYSKTKRSLNYNRCYQFFMQCKELVQLSQSKVDTIRSRFGKRKTRHIFKLLKQRVAS